ncbi:pentatricopeptide repeat-containing protein At3g18970-like [Dendrobium catenatum]|uniref:pentatricopeptide repeat-containing protein At3g18970-like n=1 Tax=Dendrobium catenatum TaxID=906689 RepID=UPI00109F6D78|nr:pentatricopeptide repeat-containing protein At3g18970-like [Dendrobium catenatum]
MAFIIMSEWLQAAGIQWLDSLELRQPPAASSVNPPAPIPRHAIVMLQLLPRMRCVALLELSSHRYQTKQIHAQMITNALLRDTLNIAKLIEKYRTDSQESCEGGATYSRFLFRQATEEIKDTFLCNVMLKYASPEESIRFFADEMMRVAPPDYASYAYVFRSCARLRAAREGKQVHARVLKEGLESQLALATTCVYFYALCRDMEAARRLFDKMTERSSVSWNAMITGYCVNGLAKEALLLFKGMAYSEARPTERTTLLLLSACSQLGDLALGATVHSLVLKTIQAPLDCPFIGTGLVEMYSKCGSLENASALFGAMKQRNVITWSTMAAAFAIHGEGKVVVELINLMEKEGIVPNAITFTSLLSACCHAGLVEEGLHLFDEMQSRFNVVPRMQHYGCIVDLLGRAGMVEEAHEFIKNMPVKPDAVVWRALLGACKIHGEAELGSKIGKILIGHKQLPVESMPVTACEDFIALSNMYASTERWEEVHTVRTAMKKKGIQNKPGRSSVQNVQTRLKMQTGIAM